MTIHLPAELEQFVREQVLAGRYDSEDAVIRQALEEFRGQVPTSKGGPGMTESEYKRHLLHTGRVSSLPTPAPPGSRPVFSPIKLEGEPLSETIIRERR